MLAYQDEESALGVTEQLYTPRGAQGFGTYDKVSKFGVSPSNYEDLVMLFFYNGKVATNFQVRPLFTTKKKPKFVQG